jgi:signal transduction histidine kinase
MTTRTSERSDHGRYRWIQTAGPWVVTGSGVLLAAVEFWHIGEMSTPYGKLIEGILPLLFAFALIYAGLWLHRARFDGPSVMRILGWYLIGLISMLLVTVWVVGHQLFMGHPFPHLSFVMTNAAIVGCIGGIIIGMYDVRSRLRERALTVERQNLAAERERMAFLNHLLRHHVLNEMNVILGRTATLQGQLTAAEQSHLRTMQRSGEDIVDLIQNVRTFARISSEGGNPERRAVDLSHVLSQAVEKLLLSYESVTVTASIPAEIRVLADELLGEVFKNVLDNAVQHNTTSSVHVDVSATVDEEHVTVIVADNGPGIPDDARSGLFELGETDLADTGHGIGLAISKLLVDRYGGDIRVEDADPPGTAFQIELRLATPDETCSDESQSNRSQTLVPTTEDPVGSEYVSETA